jgi:hypothetical protein
MLNVTSEAAGSGAGVLLRALEPLEGIDRMRSFRGGANLLDLTRGQAGSPGRCRLISGRTVWICAPRVLCGSRRAGGGLGPLARVYGSV